jgi:hypothetical protein
MEQHPLISKSITEVAPRYDHGHVRFVDRLPDHQALTFTFMFHSIPRWS